MPENRIIDSHREMFLLQVRGQDELAGAWYHAQEPTPYIILQSYIWDII